MNGLEATIGINGFSNGFWSINHWSRWFFRLATIGLDGFAMVFGLVTIGLDGFSMVANHWSNDGMVMIHRYGLNRSKLFVQTTVTCKRNNRSGCHACQNDLVPLFNKIKWGRMTDIQTMTDSRWDSALIDP